MADYLARVELNDAEGTDAYEKLYEAMKGVGFKKTIVNDKGVELDLPTGTYVLNTSNPVEIDKLEAKVDVAAESTGMDHQVFLVEFGDCRATLNPTKKKPKK